MLQLVISTNLFKISLLEINRSINILFQIVDFNQDSFISKSEISELKNIIDFLK